MNVTKIKSEPLTRAYATAHLKLDGKDFVLYASESTVGVPGFAYAYDLAHPEQPELVWDNAGGCMAIVQHPYEEDAFLAVQEFYLKENPSRAKIVTGKRSKDGKWTVKDLVSVPLVHRFGFIRDEGTAYLVICTVARQKDNKDDWSKPGEIFVAPLPKGDEPVQLTLLQTGLFKNHGFYSYQEDGKDVICVGSENGAYTIRRSHGAFQMEKILDGAIGEVALHDIDGDDKLELLTIEPFHGNRIRLYHLNEENKYKPIWEYAPEIDFAHALTGGQLMGKECFVAGIRKANGEAFALYEENGRYVTELIDQGCGPANLCIIHANGKEYVSCANHTTGECALYEIEP